MEPKILRIIGGKDPHPKIVLDRGVKKEVYLHSNRLSNSPFNTFKLPFGDGFYNDIYKLLEGFARKTNGINFYRDDELSAFVLSHRSQIRETCPMLFSEMLRAAPDPNYPHLSSMFLEHSDVIPDTFLDGVNLTDFARSRSEEIAPNEEIGASFFESNVCIEHSFGEYGIRLRKGLFKSRNSLSVRKGEVIDVRNGENSFRKVIYSLLGKLFCQIDGPNGRLDGLYQRKKMALFSSKKTSAPGLPHHRKRIFFNN